MSYAVNTEKMLQLFARLVSIDSLSFGERGIADVLKSELKALGFEVSEDDAGEKYGSDTGNIYAYLPGTNPSADPVLLSAHMDTVVPGIGKKAVIDYDEGIITSEGDTVLGADDVAGIVEILEGVRLAKDNSPGYGDIEILFTIAEEVYGKGAKEFDYDRIKSNHAYVADMSGAVGRAARSAPSIITFEFNIKGRPAHAGFAPEKGINAVAVAADIISSTKQGLVGEGLTLNIGTISGGKASNRVPDQVNCTGEIRGNDHDTAMQALSSLERSIRVACEAAGAVYTFNSSIMIRAYETPLTDKSCETFIKACSRLGLKGELVSTRGGSDNNIFARHGIKGIVLSTGMVNTHSTEEFIKTDELEAGCRLVAELISLGSE